jgi:hypothetical protein
MKVKELIYYLQNCDPESEIFIHSELLYFNNNKSYYKPLSFQEEKTVYHYTVSHPKNLNKNEYHWHDDGEEWYSDSDIPDYKYTIIEKKKAIIFNEST